MRYIFADCRLDTTTREFVRNGEEVHLTPKAYELLRLLVEHRPRVMPKQELMDELWPGTFVVEANLHVLIGELRSACGEKSTRGGSIKTHHGIGYSFTSVVREMRSRRSSKDRSRVALDVGTRRIPLVAGPNQIGRDRDCDVSLDDVSVSRQHARIEVAGGAATVEDLASKNGTQVNGTRIVAPVPVGNGDTIAFGTVQARVVILRLEDPSTVTM